MQRVRMKHWLSKSQSLAIRLLFFIAFASITFIIIVFARGYRIDPDPKDKQIIVPTGIIACYSSPKAANIYINGRFKGATDQNINMPPGKYKITIKKDGYKSWEKEINLKGELVETIDAVLFPKNPSLIPITNLELVNAFTSPDHQKIIAFSDNKDRERDGIYALDISPSILNFRRNMLLLNLKTEFAHDYQPASASAIFSPDKKQVIVDLVSLTEDTEVTNSYVLTTNETKLPPIDITQSRESLLKAWSQQYTEIMQSNLNFFPAKLRKIASQSAEIIQISQDENKIFYKATKEAKLPLVIDPPLIGTNQTPQNRTLIPNSLYVYDRKEDRNYLLPFSSEQKNTAGQNTIPNIVWHPNSKNLIRLADKKIIACDYDGLNDVVLYSGPLSQDFFAISHDGRLIILTNLNPTQNKVGELYEVGIK